MKLFLDTASIADITQWKETGIVDGITTNPTNLSKEGSSPVEVIRAICGLMPHGDISVEVTESEPEAVYAQAKRIAALSPQILVKIPCHRSYYGVIRRLVQEGIPLNITLVFSLMQAVFMAKLGVRYVSPFIGRLEDVGEDGIGLIYQIRQVYDQYGFETEILAASVRTLDHANAALLAGADAITLPVKLLPSLIDHPLTDKGIALFEEDWRKIEVDRFP